MLRFAFILTTLFFLSACYDAEGAERAGYHSGLRGEPYSGILGPHSDIYRDAWNGAIKNTVQIWIIPPWAAPINLCPMGYLCLYRPSGSTNIAALWIMPPWAAPIMICPRPAIQVPAKARPSGIPKKPPIAPSPTGISTRKMNQRTFGNAGSVPIPATVPNANARCITHRAPIAPQTKITGLACAGGLWTLNLGLCFPPMKLWQTFRPCKPYTEQRDRRLQLITYLAWAPECRLDGLEIDC